MKVREEKRRLKAEENKKCGVPGCGRMMEEIDSGMVMWVECPIHGMAGKRKC
jgi:hypothetical protein